MAKVTNIDFDAAGWDQVLTEVVNKWALPRAEAIAAAANAQVQAQAESLLAQPDTAVEPAGNTYADKVNAERKTKRQRANRKIAHIAPPAGKRDYMVSAEGSDPLNLKDYRATVIAVTDRAKIDNARFNTLIRLMGTGSGA